MKMFVTAGRANAIKLKGQDCPSMRRRVCITNHYHWHLYCSFSSKTCSTLAAGSESHRAGSIRRVGWPGFQRCRESAACMRPSQWELQALSNPENELA